MADPDFVFDPEDWECTYAWSDRADLAEAREVEHSDIVRFSTLVRGPDTYCARIDDEYRWFSTRAEAEAAWKTSQVPTGE